MCTSPFSFTLSAARRNLFRDPPELQEGIFSSTTPAFLAPFLPSHLHPALPWGRKCRDIGLISSVLRTGEERCACRFSGCVKRGCRRVRAWASVVSAGSVDSLELVWPPSSVLVLISVLAAGHWDTSACTSALFDLSMLEFTQFSKTDVRYDELFR